MLTKLYIYYNLNFKFYLYYNLNFKFSIFLLYNKYLIKKKKKIYYKIYKKLKYI